MCVEPEPGWLTSILKVMPGMAFVICPSMRLPPSVSFRLNEVMKVLTVISALFIPLTFVCSIYGMNFDTKVSPWNMPELEWAYGYPFFWGVILAVSAIQLIYFWRRGWLTSDSSLGVRPAAPGRE